MLAELTVLGSIALATAMFTNPYNVAYYQDSPLEAAPYVMKICPEGSTDHRYFNNPNGFTFRCLAKDDLERIDNND